MAEKRVYYAKQLTGLPPETSGAEKAGIDNPLWLPCPGGMEAFARLGYTAASLLVQLSAREEKPLSRFSGLLNMVCLDSCLEFFFCPAAVDDRYFNFEFNPQGAMYLGFGRDRRSSVRQVLSNYRDFFSVAPFSRDEWWGLDFSIPLSFIQMYVPAFQLKPGYAFRGNFYKCGDETAAPHYLAWNPVHTDHPDFHRPADFGDIVLGE
jgi:hypothetical protein